MHELVSAGTEVIWRPEMTKTFGAALITNQIRLTSGNPCTKRENSQWRFHSARNAQIHVAVLNFSKRFTDRVGTGAPLSSGIWH